MSEIRDEVREKLAELEHEQWVYWSRNLAKVEHISEERLARWEKLWVPYSELTEKQKDDDRKWADIVLSIPEIASQNRKEEGWTAS